MDRSQKKPPSSFDEINRVAKELILPGIVEAVNKTSPFLDFLRGNELSSVYACAERYGYKSPCGKRQRVEKGGGWR